MQFLGYFNYHEIIKKTAIMLILAVIYLWTLKECVGIKYIELKQTDVDKALAQVKKSFQNLNNSQEISGNPSKDSRRYWLASSNLRLRSPLREVQENEADKDENLKSKIAILVEQAVHDTETKIESIKELKERHRAEAPYKAGFVLSLIKKSKTVMSELFNVAVKHKDDWKALEQLKVFELIVHTNVDTTNLVRQLVEIHVQHMNATASQDNRRRVVLIK